MNNSYLQFRESAIWRWILISFVMAGFTGFLFRFGFLEPLNFGLDLTNIRQAHSHLMFFGWAGIFPLYFINLVLKNGAGDKTGLRLMRLSLWVILAFSILSYPTFMLWGYHLVVMGDANLPISAMLSSGVMLGWYLFTVGYIRCRKSGAHDESLVWFDGALIMLFVSSLGAWATGAVQMFHIGPEFLEQLLPHFFLTTYTEGWILLSLLGIFYRILEIKADDLLISVKTMVFLICIGAPMAFPYGMPGLLENPMQSLFARIGSFTISATVLTYLYSMYKTGVLKHTIWIWPAGFLFFKVIMQLTATFLPYGNLLADPASRIFYLHMLFLGSYTVAVSILFAGQRKETAAHLKFIMASVILVLVSLTFMTWLWPASLTGGWIFYALALAAIGPVIAVAALWIKLETEVV